MRIVDVSMALDKYANVAREDVINKLRALDAVFIPNRSLAVYVGYETIEGRFPAPIFGNRYLLRYEERVGDETYYRFLT
ncbi:MAG: DUF1246 domain-containing protein [Vulcanisaeta sp.]|uniref:DUF1246 domain-containing protein n=1 Tax=Vulcanisaeta sp. TaxID=2020871 RepID=UPI003D0AC5C1